MHPYPAPVQVYQNPIMQGFQPIMPGFVPLFPGNGGQYFPMHRFYPTQTIHFNPNSFRVALSLTSYSNPYRKYQKNINNDAIKEFYYQNGQNITKTCKQFHIGHERLQKILHDHLAPPSRRKTTKIQDEYIINLAKNGLLTAQEIADAFNTEYHMNISKDTIIRRLHEKGYSYSKPRVTQALTDAQIQVRFNFATAMIEKDEDYYKSIIFSDESRFCNSPDNLLIWRHPDDFSDKVCISSAKKNISVMIWGAIGMNFKSKLYFHKKTVNEEAYIECLTNTDIFNECDAVFGKGKYIFQQDGAPAHTTESCIDFLLSKARVLHGWPPNSPDLSPIEMIWGHMKCRLSKLPPAKTITELENQLTRLWDEISFETINRLISSFKSRLQMVLDVGGHSISHFLSANKYEIPAEYHKEKPRVFDNEVIQLIYQKSFKNHRKWTKTAREIENEKGVWIDPIIVKYKTLELSRKIKDYCRFHASYSSIPNDIEDFIKPEDLEENEDDNQNADQNVHVNINIRRNNLERTENTNPDLMIQHEQQSENDDTDWDITSEDDD